MELADTEAGKNDESPVGAASASARTLGSVAAGIESVAADGRLAVEIAAAEVVVAAPPSVAAGSVADPAVVVGIASVFQLVLVGNIVAPDDDYAALAVAFGELVAAQNAAAGELFAAAVAALSLAAGNRTAAGPVGPPSACCWTGCLRSAGSFPPPGSPSTPPR